MSTQRYTRALMGILRRETLRFAHQRGRLIAALVRPLLWLVVFAAGFRNVLGISITPPYQTYILYEVYIVPGLVGMAILFQAMQGALSMVYDREMGSMRLLLTSPLPRWFILGARLFANALVAVPISFAFLLIARAWGVHIPWSGYVFAFPAMILSGLMLGAIGLLLSSFIRQIENFAGVMNFVIFPMFFASTALYPLWRLQDASSWLAMVAAANPFTHAVELIRFALYGRVEVTALTVVAVSLAVAFLVAVKGYDPGRGLWRSRQA